MLSILVREWQPWFSLASPLLSDRVPAGKEREWVSVSVSVKLHPRHMCIIHVFILQSTNWFSVPCYIYLGWNGELKYIPVCTVVRIAEKVQTLILWISLRSWCEFSPFPLSGTVQFGMETNYLHYHCQKGIKGYQITVPCHTYFDQPSVGVPSSPKGSQEVELRTLQSVDCKQAKGCF